MTAADAARYGLPDEDEACGEVEARPPPWVALLQCGGRGLWWWAHHVVETRLLWRRGAPGKEWRSMIPPYWSLYRDQYCNRRGRFRPHRHLGPLITSTTTQLLRGWQAWRMARGYWMRLPPRSFLLVALWEDFPDLAYAAIAAGKSGHCRCLAVDLLGEAGAVAWFTARAAREDRLAITRRCECEKARCVYQIAAAADDPGCAYLLPVSEEALGAHERATALRCRT